MLPPLHVVSSVTFLFPFPIAEVTCPAEPPIMSRVQNAVSIAPETVVHAQKGDGKHRWQDQKNKSD